MRDLRDTCSGGLVAVIGDFEGIYAHMGSYLGGSGPKQTILKWLQSFSILFPEFLRSRKLYLAALFPLAFDARNFLASTLNLRLRPVVQCHRVGACRFLCLLPQLIPAPTTH